MRFIAIFLFASIAYCSDTITFSSYQAPKLYNYSYSYSKDRDDDRHYSKDRDDDRHYSWDRKYSYKDDKYEYGHPSIPEPSTWTLLAGVCALSAAFIKRRKTLTSKP